MHAVHDEHNNVILKPKQNVTLTLIHTWCSGNSLLTEFEDSPTSFNRELCLESCIKDLIFETNSFSHHRLQGTPFKEDPPEHSQGAESSCSGRGAHGMCHVAITFLS